MMNDWIWTDWQKKKKINLKLNLKYNKVWKGCEYILKSLYPC